MPDSAVRADRLVGAGGVGSWPEQVLEALGVTVAQVLAWVGPTVAAAWFWTASRGPDSWAGVLPSESPVSWAQRVTGAAGISERTAAAVSGWLHAHEYLYWGWLIAAVLLACHAVSARQRGTLVSLATLCLLAALEIGEDPDRTWEWFILASALLCLVAVIHDMRPRRFDERDYLNHPMGSLAGWISCPGWVAGAMLFLPLLVIAGAIEAFRVPAPVREPQTPTGAAIVPLQGTRDLTAVDDTTASLPGRHQTA